VKLVVLLLFGLKEMTDNEAGGCCFVHVAVIDKVQDQLEAARPATLVDEVVRVHIYFIIYQLILLIYHHVQ